MLSLAKYRDFLDISPGNEGDLIDLKEEVESLWDKITQRPWQADAARVETQRVCGNRIKTLFLQLSPVTSITKVEVKSESGGATDWDELEAADEGWEVHNDQLIRFGTYWKPLVRITYSAGYATDACPADVKRALKLQAKFIRDRQDKVVDVSAENFAGGNGSYVDPDYHLYFLKTAESYRRLV